MNKKLPPAQRRDLRCDTIPAKLAQIKSSARNLQRSGVQLSKKLASLGIMGTKWGPHETPRTARHTILYERYRSFKDMKDIGFKGGSERWVSLENSRCTFFAASTCRVFCKVDTQVGLIRANSQTSRRYTWVKSCRGFQLKKTNKS